MSFQKSKNKFQQAEDLSKARMKQSYSPLLKIQEYSTNNVLKDEQKNVIYLPAFMRLKFKNFNDLDIGGLSALLNGQIVLVIFYGQAFQNLWQKKLTSQQVYQIVENTLMKNIVLLFARDNAIKLTNNKEQNKQKQLDIKVNHDRQRRQVKFILKKIFKLYLDSEIFLTPFQIINGILQVTVQSISIKQPQPKDKQGKSKISKSSKSSKSKKWKIQFNLQDHYKIQSKVTFANWGRFGNYDLAQNRIGALYTNYRISQGKQFRLSLQQRIKHQQMKKLQQDLQDGNAQLIKITSDTKLMQSITQNKSGQVYQRLLHQKDTKIQAFHYAYFNIPLYKFPWGALVTIFMPLFFLDILNFGILFQDPALSDRMGSIATLVLAFAALIPTIRNQIPPNPRITLIQILVYLQTVPTLLAIIQSLFLIDQIKQDNVQYWTYDYISSGYFWVTLAISGLTMIVIVVLTCLYKFLWFKQYNEVAERQKKQIFKRTIWRNKQCDKYYDDNFTMDRKGDVIIIKKKQVYKLYKYPKDMIKKHQKTGTI